MSKTKKIGKYTVNIVMPSDNINEFISKSDAMMDARAVKAVKVALEKAEFCEKPIAKYNVSTGKAYLKHGDKKPMEYYTSEGEKYAE